MFFFRRRFDGIGVLLFLSVLVFPVSYISHADDRVRDRNEPSMVSTVAVGLWNPFWMPALGFLMLTGAAGWAWRLRTQERDLEHRSAVADRQKQEFLSKTAEELRTPIDGITGLVESMLEGSAGSMSESAHLNLGMIAASGERLSRTIDDLLDLSRLQHEELQIEQQPVDMHSLTDVVLSLARPLLRREDLRLRNAIPLGLPPALGDERRIQQILMQLIDNAIKFTEKGSVEVSATHGGQRLVICVRDTGVGIDPDDQSSIFEAFIQAESTVDQPYRGTGLGLALSRELVELHGGHLRVQSQLGRGSDFLFDLPVATEELTVRRSTKTSRRRARQRAPRHYEPTTAELDDASLRMAAESINEQVKILVVDDEPINREVLRNLLLDDRIQLTMASNGRRALELIEKRSFHLVLLDVMMPRMSGFEVCQVIRETHPLESLPVIFLASRSQAADVVEGLAVGANDYLTKPISRKELLARLQPHLDLARIRQDLERRVEEKVAELEILSGLLPICAQCKSVRDDEGLWEEIEVYIRSHSEVDFSHSICPACVEDLYPDIDLSSRA